MDTLHNQQERDIELNDVKERHLPIETNDHDAKSAPVSNWITRGKKRAIIHYHSVITKNQLYLFLFTIGVSMDTLFLYIPVIHENNKCVTIENKLKDIALVLRSLKDIFFLEHILYLVAFAPPRSRVRYFNLLVDILAIAPFSQVLILHFFTRVGTTKQMIKRKGLNSIIALQYFPRIIKIYLTYLGIKKGSFISPKAVIFWNLMFFFGLSHMVGSFWYFFAVQRKTSCWREACKQNISCVPTSFDCEYNSTMTNFTFISNLCSINQPNTSTNFTFNFGIYEEAIRTGLLDTSNFPKKILYSFWWGLRNLSSSGQNLESSGYVWETLFAAFITTFGLMLFLYFIGQVQVYLQILTIPITKEKWMRMRYRERDVETWLTKNKILNKDKIKEAIMRKIRHTPDIEGVDLKIILSLLPSKERKYVKSSLCHPTLKKVAALQNVDSKVMEYITTCLNPVTYSENNDIIREGEPLSFMLIITQGVIWSFKTSDGNCNKVNIMGKGYVYGEELLERTLKSIILRVDPYSDIPISNTNMKAHTKVEAFTIMHTDIKKLVSKFKTPITESLKKSGKEVLNLDSSAASIIQSTMRWRHRFDHNK